MEWLLRSGQSVNKRFCYVARLASHFAASGSFASRRMAGVMKLKSLDCIYAQV